MQKISMKAARVNAGYTQEELAKKLGVTKKSIANWEKGIKKIRKAHFIAFCTVTGFSEDEIFLAS